MGVEKKYLKKITGRFRVEPKRGEEEAMWIPGQGRKVTFAACAVAQRLKASGILWGMDT